MLYYSTVDAKAEEVRYATADGPEVTFVKITEEALAKMRAKFGKTHHPQVQNAVASQDAIRQFAWGIGDDNPLR